MYPGRLEELIAGQELRIRMMRHAERADPAFLPIALVGGIGDALLSITTLRRLKKEGYKLLVSSVHAEAFRYFFKDIQIFSDALPDFTWRVEIDSIARFKFEKGFDGFMILDHEMLFAQQRAFFREHPDMEYLVNQHPRDKYALTRRAREIGGDAVTFPLLCLGFKDVVADGSQMHVPADNYITIHDGYDANYHVSGRSTKQWEWASWNSLVAQIRAAYPQIDIVQVGSKTSRLIDGVTRNMVNKTTITEAFDIIARAKLHIDTDSGLVHAATALGVPCVVMFGPTPKEFYGHAQNVNVSRETYCAGSCFHLARNWMDKCPVGYQSPKCMDAITSATVMDAVWGILK